MSCSLVPGSSRDGVIIAEELSSKAIGTADPLAGLPRMTGVNWFGFETDTFYPHGLWQRDYKSMLQQMKSLGFNTIRIPFSNATLRANPAPSLMRNANTTDPYTGKTGVNVDLMGLTSLEIMDKIIDAANDLGIMIILDNHSREPGGYYTQTLWYTAAVSEDQWVADWETLARRYKDKRNVVAYDLNNEPHGGLLGMGMKPPASWGYDVPGYGITDWRKAAIRVSKAIMAIDSDVRLVIQGVQESKDGTNAWWGSNHKDLLTYPLTELPASRVIYSVHEYGPEVHAQDWLEAPDFPANLPAAWRERFWFIYEQKIGGLYVGEMGIKEETASDVNSIPYRWFDTFLKFAGNKIHWTYWSWNPNSGDTGGILKDDWVTVNPKKYAMIKPYLNPQFLGSPVPNPDPDPRPDPTPDPTPGNPSAVYKNNQLNASSNTIGFQVRISSPTALKLSDLRIQYGYTNEFQTAQTITIDHGGISGGTYRNVTAGVTGSIVVQGGLHLGQLGFQSALGTLAPGEVLELQVRITNQNWQNYNQANDPSFRSLPNTYTDNLAVYLGGQRLSGPIW